MVSSSSTFCWVRSVSAERDACLTASIAGAAAPVAAGDTGDRFVRGSGRAVERDFGAVGRGFRQAWATASVMSVPLVKSVRMRPRRVSGV